MKIEHFGIKITDVPGVERITVRPHDERKGNVEIWIKVPGVAPIPYTIDELTELIDALTGAANHARFMEGQNSGD